MFRLEAPRPHLQRQPPGDLAHGRQQRQRAVVQCDGLVADGGDAPLAQDVRQLGLRRQMEIGEDRQVRPQVAELLGERFLDLHDHIGPAPYVWARSSTGCAGGRVGAVGDMAAPAGVSLHQHLVAVGDEGRRPGGRQRHPVFLGFQLFRYAYDH